ncbi:hypothetical protein KI387_043968 [Taxus chinensis]|uniref:Uncharacterized protein n=1 Tax=Taxus chinensis TaxID=29808 RepID=A0AA38GEH0_TAXCH|nr:hypothetical protein KI387_043968 [Taxus chinensis]
MNLPPISSRDGVKFSIPLQVCPTWTRWNFVIFSFTHSIERLGRKSRSFLSHSYEEVLEGVTLIDQATIESGRKIYGPNGKLVSPNQNNANYQNNGANNQGPKGVNQNHGATMNSATDQAKNTSFTNNGNTNNNNNMGNQRAPNTVSSVNTFDVNHPSQKKNQTQGPNQYQNSGQGETNHGYNNQFQNYNRGYNQQQQDAYQRPRDYDPNLYCGFHKGMGSLLSLASLPSNNLGLGVNMIELTNEEGKFEIEMMPIKTISEGCSILNLGFNPCASETKLSISMGQGLIIQQGSQVNTTLYIGNKAEQHSHAHPHTMSQERDKEDLLNFQENQMGGEKRRKRVMNTEIVVASELSMEEENCYNENENTAEQENCSEESEQFKTQTEEDNHNEEDRDHAIDGQAEAEQLDVSEAMEANIQQIQEKMEQFTQRVSGLLETGKNFFVEMSNEFEERIVMIHQEQIDKWQEEIQLLRRIDSINEDMNARLHDAQYLLHTTQMD